MVVQATQPIAFRYNGLGEKLAIKSRLWRDFGLYYKHMDPIAAVVLFVFGLAVGSFVNVVALRYDGDHFSFSPKVIGGRSHCPHCKRTLRWFELVPLASFLAQGGRCRRCRARIGWQYPFAELLSGLIFVFVPAALVGAPVVAALWVVAFELLLLVAYIDIRLQIVPDELTAMLGAVAIFAAIFSAGAFGAANHSFLAAAAAPFGLQGYLWVNRLAAALIGSGFFALLILVTRGKGMGWGDVKLAAPLGFLFGWPDIIFLLAAAFIAGALASSFLLLRKEKTMKSALPFAPFLAFAAAFVFFFGAAVLGWYFHIIGV